MSKIINIKLNKKPCYDVVIEKGFNHITEHINALDENIKERRCCIITDDTVKGYYADKAIKVLEKSFKEVILFSFPAGEDSKNINTVMQAASFLCENNFSRKDYLAALGGGVVGDLTGFVASIYMRGIKFIQIPTTLLACVDSSVGGKTGVDLNEYKNLIGAFKMPELVYISTNTIGTLTARQYYSGMGEVLKYGLISDAAFYSWILQNMYGIFDQTPECLEEMIGRCVELKARVVESDPYEEGLRKILNFGHTLGHAIEKYMDFKLYHGECVALGMVCASYISWKMNMITTEEHFEIRDMMVPFNLPISVDELDFDEIIKIARKDKKNTDDDIKFVLLKKVGKATWDNKVSVDMIKDALEQINFTEEDMKE